MSGEIQKQFLLTSKIGNGNFSTVYLAKHIQTQQIVAVKTMKNHIPIAIKQAQILKKMNHPNVIKLYKFQKPKNKDQALIVLEYVPQNILQLYEAQQYGLKEDQVKCILFQSCMGLYHIHKKGIIHRDIKPENIMINRNKAEVKLIDFGLAIEQDKCITDYVATRWYRAPENLLGTKEYTVAIDIFSLGCVVVELYMGNPLFPGANNIDQISKILSMIEEPTIQTWRKGYEMLNKLGLKFHASKEKKKVSLRTFLSSCSEGLTKVIEKMLILNPFKRITAEQILRDPYFKDIEKIIPPHVYDQYLIDFKSARDSIAKELPKPQRRNESKQRIRFLSEEKSFGAFSSFKPNNPLNKFQQQFKRERQKIQPSDSESSKKLSLEKIIKGCGSCDQDNGEASLFSKSGVSSSIRNQIIKDPSASIQQNHKTEITDISSSIKNSIEKYEENFMKLSSSLNKIKFLKSASELNTQKPESQIQSGISSQIKNTRSSQMLSFRGFNQPKQRILIKETGSTFLKKNPQVSDQKLDKFPVKNKKVMEYLQKFQTTANQSQQLQKHKLENSRSEPIIYQSVNGSPKKQQILVTSGLRQFQSRQKPQNDKLQASFSNSSFRLNLNNSKESLLSNQSSSNILSQSFQKELIQSSEGFIVKSSDSMVRPQNLRKSFQIERTSNHQSPPRHSMQQPQIKYSPFIQEHQGIQSQFVPVQNSIYRQRIMAEDTQHLQNTSIRNSQTFFKEPQSLNSSNYFGNSRTPLNYPTPINISANRPIQNKIKLIAVRDNMEGNFNRERSIQSQNPKTGIISSANTSRNPSYYNGSNFMTQNIGSHSALHSPGQQPHYVYTSQQNYPSELQSKQYFIDLNQLTTKQFKSLEHREFFSKKVPSTRYSINDSDGIYNPGYPNNYISINESKSNLQKNHQTTLSQLRQSITGLTQSLNEGALFSERSEKYNNNNININLNLNIYEKKGPKKR